MNDITEKNITKPASKRGAYLKKIILKITKEIIFPTLLQSLFFMFIYFLRGFYYSSIS